MTEQEYIDMQNRIHISSAMHHLRNTSFIADDGNSRQMISNIIFTLQEIESKLFSKLKLDSD